MHADSFLKEVAEIADGIDREQVEKLVVELDRVHRGRKRLFLLGLGGSAANCSHAAADFRKLCKIDARTLTDSAAEFSARANDDGFANTFTDWLEASGADVGDAILILSVGGGTNEVSLPITRAIAYAVANGVKILGIVGPEGGYTAKLGDVVVRVPAPEMKRVTPHSEAFQAVIWHLLVSHPTLQKRSTKW